jgi:hypothetical protein
VSAPLLEVRDLKVHFPVGGGLIGKPRNWVRAVDGISFVGGRATPPSASSAKAAPARAPLRWP